MRIILVTIVCLSLSVLAVPCVRCGIGGCHSTTGGGCECDDGGSTCSSCGFCNVFGGCTQPCPFLISDTGGIKDSQWFLNRNLPGEIKAHSYTLGTIWGDLQERMIRTGKAHLKDGMTHTPDRKHYVEWHAYHASGTQYASITLDGKPLPPDAPEAPNRLVLDRDKWTLYRDTKFMGFWPKHEAMANGTYK